MNNKTRNYLQGIEGLKRSQNSRFILTIKHLCAHSGYDLKVSERGDDGGDVAQHAPNSQQQEHEEVEHRPQLGQRHAHYCFTVHDESQTGSLRCLQNRTRHFRESSWSMLSCSSAEVTSLPNYIQNQIIVNFYLILIPNLYNHRHKCRYFCYCRYKLGKIR